MKMRILSAAVIVGLAGCVSDDQVSGTAASAVENRSPRQSESTVNSTTEAQSSTSRPDTTDADDLDAADSSVSPADNSSGSTRRTQGDPITVTTVGSEEIGKKSVQSNVNVSDSWCEASESGSLLALAEISNSGTLEGDFIVEFEVLNALGVRVGEGVDVVYEVKPGQSFVAREIVSDVVGWEGDPRSWTCQVLRISTPDAVLGD